MFPQKATTIINEPTIFEENSKGGSRSDTSSHNSANGQWKAAREPSVPSKERRLAPRSSNQFRVGPPFSTTVTERPIVNSNKEPVVPKISARLDRGFDMIDGEWIGYKRNYFTLVASFVFLGHPLSVVSSDTFELVSSKNVRKSILAFKISLTSVCLEDSSTAVTLVQHTAKRDRGPQNAPPIYYAVPGELPGHHMMKSVANIRNGDKIDRCNRLFYLSQHDRKQLIENNPNCTLATYPNECEVSLVARYERIQFSSAGCGNRKSASTNNKHYILVVQLLGATESGEDVLLASTQSPPLIVRGRSPSNYPQSNPKLMESSVCVKECTQSVIHDEENSFHPKKKRHLASIPKKLPLHPNLAIPNGNFSEIVDPILARSTRGETTHSDSENVDDSISRLHCSEKSQFTSYPRTSSSKDSNAGLIISQDYLFPLVEECHSWQNSYSVSDVEPLNVYPSTPNSPCEYTPGRNESYIGEEDKYLNNLIEEYSSFPAPICFPEILRASTPLQLQFVEQPHKIGTLNLRNLRGGFARCKHGFKKRENLVYDTRLEKKYTYADLTKVELSDKAFAEFKTKFESFRPRVRGEMFQDSSSHSSPLTMLESEPELFYFG